MSTYPNDDAPTIYTPPAVSTIEDESTLVKSSPGITITDAESDTLTVTFTTSDGTMTLGDEIAATFTVTGTAEELTALFDILVFSPRFVEQFGRFVRAGHECVEATRNAG